MKNVKLNKSNFQYTWLDHPDDVMTLPLSRNLFGLNNRIYANLGSIGMSDEMKEELKKNFTDEELRFPLINRLFQVHIHTRTRSDEYDTIEKIDFKELFEFVKNKHSKFESIYASFYDDGDKTDKELGVLYIPLGAKVLMTASNYAYQEIENLKMDNFIMDISNAKYLNNFLSVF